MYQLPPVTSHGGGCSPRRIFQRDWTEKKHTDCRQTKCCEYITSLLAPYVRLEFFLYHSSQHSWCFLTGWKFISARLRNFIKFFVVGQVALTRHRHVLLALVSIFANFSS